MAVLNTTALSQDTAEYLRLFLGDHLAGATWADAHRGPLPGETDARIRSTRDTRLRLRLLIAGIVGDEAWLDTAAPDAQRWADITAAVHTEGVDAARANDVPWLIEVYQPSAPPEAAYLRVGSDPGRMVAPVPLVLADAENEVN